MRKTAVGALLLFAWLGGSSQVLYPPVPGGGPGLPAATAAGQTPVSTGAGTTYTAQGVVLNGGNLNSTQSMASQLLNPVVNASFYADGFPSSGYSYAGTWNSSTTYNRFQTVTSGGVDWIAVNGSVDVPPVEGAAGASQFWYQCNTTGTGVTATQADAAFAWAWGQVQVHSTAFGNPAGADLYFGSGPVGGYTKNCDWNLPTNTFGNTLNLHGGGRGSTWINQGVSTLHYMVNQAQVSSSTGQIIDGITFNANDLAGGCLSFHNRRSILRDLVCWLPKQQSGGTIGAAMWLGQGADAYELLAEHLLVRTDTYTLTPAYGTASVTAGAITGITWTGTGAGLDGPTQGVAVYFSGKGAGAWPCATMPVVSAVALTGGSINTSTGIGGLTFSNAGVGCTGTIYVKAQQAPTLAEAYYLGASDSTFNDIVTSGDFSNACEYVDGPVALYHEHPYCAAPFLILDTGNGLRDHYAAELDSPIQYGVELGGSGATWHGTFIEFNAAESFGAGDFLIYNNATNFAIDSSGCYAGSSQNFGGYAKFTGLNAGVITQANAYTILANSGSITGTQENCDGSLTLWGNYQPQAPGDSTNAANVVLVDDFLGGGVGNDNVGALGWGIGAANGSGQTYAMSSQSSSNHPGVMAMTTGTTSGYGAQLNLVNYGMTPYSGTNWSMQWIMEESTVSTVAWRAGFASTYPSGTVVANGYYFRYDTTIPDSTIKFCVSYSSTETCTSTGQTPSASTWYDYYMWSTTAGTIYAQVGSNTPISACSSGCTLSTSMPTSQMLPVTWVNTETSSAATEYIDYFKYVQTGLSR